jgi:hypothetical protein
MLIQLTYMSRLLGSDRGAVLQDILQSSRRNNRMLGITGMLVVKGDKFFQALEGEADKVHDLYAKISRDKRHGGVIKIGEKTITERAFATWDMGFKNLDDTLPGDAAILKSVDFNDPAFIKDPEHINGIFRALIEKN